MKKSQLLNKIYLTILVFFLLQGTVTHAEDPVDIWKIEENSKKKIESSEIIKKDETVVGILTGRQKDAMIPVDYHSNSQNTFANPPKN